MEKLHRMQEERMRQQMLLHQLGYGSSRSENAGATKDGPILSSLLAPGSSSKAASAAPSSKGSGASSASSSK